MNRVIQQPASSPKSIKHYQDTIEQPVPQARILQHAPELGADLARLYGNRLVAIWGVVPGSEDRNVGRWGRLAPGDVALFAGSGKIFATALVTMKAHSAPLAAALWGYDEQGQTWEYTYFLEDVKPADIPYAIYNAAAGYEKGNIIRGFEVLSEEKSLRVIRRLGLDTDVVAAPVTAREAERAVRESFKADTTSFAGATNLSDLDVAVEAKGRAEQRALRDHLVGNRPTAPCAICGEEFPIELLTAAHVKRRSACDLEERLDFDRVAMLTCRVGCDEFFEKGYVGVDGGKVVRLDRRSAPDATPTVERRINELEGRSCPHWSEESAKYFEWHRHYHEGAPVI